MLVPLSATAVSFVKVMSTFLPRFIRLRDAPFYLGMERNRFNQDVRPYVDEIPIGKQGVAFDRLDLDAWADEYKRHNTRRVRAPMPSPGDIGKEGFEKAITHMKSPRFFKLKR